MHRFSPLLFFCLFLPSLAQSRIVQDTTSVIQRDSLTVEPVDSTRFRFFPGMGSVHRHTDLTSNLHHTQFDWTDAKYLGDLLRNIPGYYLRDIGEAGKLSQLTAFGLAGSGIPILLDGRPINDPYSGTLNLYDIPIESIERIEVLDGVDAILFGSQGTAINIVTRQYNNNRPVTKLRYMQGPFEHGLTDGLFTQNIARGTNLMLGFQRHVSDGRFTNSAYDSWHIRSRVRYNYSDRLNIALSHFYSSADNGLNGGIDTTSPSFFNEVTAVVQNPDASERTSRHDLTLTGIARMLRDTASTTQFSLFYSEVEREYQDTPNNISEATSTSLKGIRISQQFATRWHHTTVGFNSQQTKMSTNIPDIFSVERNQSSLIAKTELKLFNALHPSASARVEHEEGTPGVFRYGLGLRYIAGDILTLNGEYISYSDSRQHINATVRISFTNNSYATLTWFEYTNTFTSVFFTTLSNTRPSPSTLQYVETRGMHGLVSAHMNNLEVVGSGMITESRFFPTWIFSGEVAYRDNILKDVMELRTGVRFRYNSAHQGMEFIPQLGRYFENPGSTISQAFTLDLFAVAHLGDAYLTLSWENLLDKEYFSVARYPMPGRTFRFGFNWTFFD